MSHENAGFVYILSNPAMPGLLKVGYTQNAVHKRVAELSNTSVPTPFTVEYYAHFDNCVKAEKLAHRHLSRHRLNNNREFFQLPVEDAVYTIESMGLSFQRLFSKPEVDEQIRLKKAEEERLRKIQEQEAARRREQEVKEKNRLRLIDDLSNDFFEVNISDDKIIIIDKEHKLLSHLSAYSKHLKNDIEHYKNNTGFCFPSHYEKIISSALRDSLQEKSNEYQTYSVLTSGMVCLFSFLALDGRKSEETIIFLSISITFAFGVIVFFTLKTKNLQRKLKLISQSNRLNLIAIFITLIPFLISLGVIIDRLGV